MKPLQVWLPLLEADLMPSDIEWGMEKAYEAWSGESLVWLASWYDDDERLPESGVLTVYSWHLDRVDVYHVDQSGWVAGPEAASRFPRGRVEGLLGLWLNTSPSFREDFEIITTDVAPPDDIVTEEGEDLGGNVGYQVVVEDGKLKIVRDERLRGELPPMTVADWPEPLRKLMPIMSSYTEADARQKMATIAVKSAEDPVGALRELRDLSGRYLTEGYSTVELTEFLPALQRGDASALQFVAERYGLYDRDWEQAYESEAWKKVRMQPVPVRRAWGPVGLFSALLMDELEARRSFQSCQRCGKIIQGKRGKRFCGADDDLGCHRQRRAADKRRSRGSRRRSGG